ncbi:MAG: putative O-glycosylation ligase, exosortase A system-associated [Thiobacillus sp.]
MRDLLVAGIIFGLLPFVFKRPWIGILLWTWLAYMNPHRQTWGFAFDFPFSMVVGLVTISAFLFSKDKKEMLWTRETVLLLIFVVWMFTTTVFSLYPDDAWLQWNKVWKIQLMIFLIAMIIKDRQQLHWMIWVIAASLGYYGVKGGIFTIATGGTYRVWGPEGTFIGGNNEMALALVMVIPLIRYLHLQAERQWVRLGLASAMVLSGVSAIGSQSRGALLAMVAMGFFLWIKSRNKVVTGVYLAVSIVILAVVMPQSWYDRMNTIETYQEDASALGRINAWHTAFNVATSRITGGGFEMLQVQTFRQYAPDPFRVHDAHSIYFEVMGEQGFIGFVLFMSFGLLTWIRAQQIIRQYKHDPGKKWASDLAAMVQVSLVGYAAGGAFLGLAYFDLPYHLMIIIVLAAKFSGVLDKVPQGVMTSVDGPPIHPSSRWDNTHAWKRK